MVRAPVGQFRSSYLDFKSTWNRFHVKDKYSRNPTPCKKNSMFESTVLTFHEFWRLRSIGRIIPLKIPNMQELSQVD